MYRYIYICLIFVAFSVISCKDDRMDSFIELSTVRVDARFVSDTLTVSVKSSGTWRAVADASWVEVLPPASPPTSNTTLEFIVKDNFDKNSRQAHITVSIEDKSLSLLVSQSGLGSLPVARVRDSMALISIYEQCGGQEWSFMFEHNKPLDGWNLSAPFDSWRGVSTSLVGGVTRVTGIDLAGVGLVGALPPQIHWLDQLQACLLSDNQINESPFETLARLPQLMFVDLSYNPFRFTLPLELGSLVGLNYLYLNGVDCNSVDGGRLSRMVDLRELKMSGSKISGLFPQYLRSLVNLEHLNLSSNPIEGGLPEWLFSLAKLRVLDLSTCKMSGKVPSAIGSLTSLEVLKLGVNGFSGEIPSSIGFLSRLKTLNLAECDFSSLPLNITLCTELEYVDLAFNDIASSPFLDEFSKLERLEVFIALGNRFVGAISPQVLGSPKWKVWRAKSLICPQQVGYGFENCK